MPRALCKPEIQHLGMCATSAVYVAAELDAIAGRIGPVPGGAGPMTTATLLVDTFGPPDARPSQRSRPLGERGRTGRAPRNGGREPVGVHVPDRPVGEVDVHRAVGLRADRGTAARGVGVALHGGIAAEQHEAGQKPGAAGEVCGESRGRSGVRRRCGLRRAGQGRRRRRVARSGRAGRRGRWSGRRDGGRPPSADRSRRRAGSGRRRGPSRSPVRCIRRPSPRGAGALPGPVGDARRGDPDVLVGRQRSVEGGSVAVLRVQRVDASPAGGPGRGHQRDVVVGCPALVVRRGLGRGDAGPGCPSWCGSTCTPVRKRPFRSGSRSSPTRGVGSTRRS